jgi:K+:H+ antiporter
VFSIDVIVLLAVATAALVAGKALRLPPVVAYLMAGVLVGPGGLGLVSQSAAVDQLAELGVTLLLFGVGIEFSLDRMRRILARMIASGALQVSTTAAATAAIFRLLGSEWPVALFIGFLVSLSSTAIVFKLYDESGELDAPQGLAGAGILLFQDLTLVPMMLLVPVLAGGEGRALLAAEALVAAAVALAGLLFLARAVLPRALEMVARTGTPELFPLASLVIALGTAFAAAAMGLSLPIGAFMAGLALSGSRYAHQVFAELLPLRDAFVAIFFTSIGMLLHPATVAAEPLLLAGMLAAIALKSLFIGVIVGVVWRSRRLAILTSLGLAQIGEFSFVLGRQGATAGLIGGGLEQAFLGGAILSMAATPFLMRAARRLSLLGTGASSDEDRPPELRNHVLVIGYGVTGQAVARVLRETGIPFVAVDMVDEVVAEARRERVPVRFGDASRRAMLQDLGAERARAAVVAIGDPSATRRVVSFLRQLNGTMRILARVRRVDEIEELERLGADDPVPSEFETSIELLVRLLTHLGVPRHVVRVQEELIRLDHYHALRGTGSTPELLAETRKLVMGGILETALVMKGCEAAGKTLEELDLRNRTGVIILTIVRDEQPIPTPEASTRLEAEDLVVLYGPHAAIDRALRLLEPPDADHAAGS